MKRIQIRNSSILVYLLLSLPSSCLKETAVPISSSFSIEVSEDKYISAKYSKNLSNLELESLISPATGSESFRFDVKWSIRNRDGVEIPIFVDTKNYARAGDMFRDLGQFKAYLREIDSFDQLYIIQQGGRGVTREQIIAQLERAIAKDAESVFESNESLWRQFNISSGQQLKKICDSQGLSSGSYAKRFSVVVTLTY